MEKEKWYTCDPDKNKCCDKTVCIHNPNAIEKMCSLTTHKEFAKEDKQA